MEVMSMADELPEDQIYATIGEEGFTALVAAFYRRVRTDDILSPMYPQHELDEAEHRLREFLIQRFGGPSRYSDTRGHPRLRMRHAPFKVDVFARNRWIQLMDAALEEAKLPANIEPVLRKYFASTATFMINR
jgi:hemoglobin